MTVEERFWSKVDKKNEDECWNWIGAGRGNGYGAFKLNRKVIDAHRLSYELKNGVINNSKLYVCHKCDNKSCVNPNHLFLGTHSDNMKDAYNKGRVIVPEGRRFQLGNVPKNKKLKGL